MGLLRQTLMFASACYFPKMVPEHFKHSQDFFWGIFSRRCAETAKCGMAEVCGRADESCCSARRCS